MDRYEEAIEILVEFEFLFKYTCPNCGHRYNEVKVVRCAARNLLPCREWSRWPTGVSTDRRRGVR